MLKFTAKVLVAVSCLEIVGAEDFTMPTTSTNMESNFLKMYD